jgi:hypothetical protein
MTQRRVAGQLVSSIKRAMDLGRENHKLQGAGWVVTKVPDRALWRATRGDLSFVYSYNGRVFNQTAQGARTGEHAPRATQGEGMPASEYAVKLLMENAGGTHA